MRSSKVAKRYARALAGLSTDHHQLETWGAELERLGRLFEAPEIQASFISPEVSAAMKIEALGKIAELLELSFPVRSFTVVVAQHGRIQDLPQIADAYRRMLDDLLGRARATLTFAQTPGDTDLARLIERLETLSHKKIIPTVNIDAGLIGGVIVELEGKTYDGSLTTRLAEAQRRLAG